MPSLPTKHAAVVILLLSVCLFCSDSDLEAQTVVPPPPMLELPGYVAAPTPAAPSNTTEASIGFDRSESVESLKQRYNELEQQTHQLADKIKQSSQLSEAQRTELQLAVRSSFDARQALQRAELADLARRMQSIQQSIDMRYKLVDKVIERRVEDLLNPNLKWDLTEPTPTAQRASSAMPKSIKEAVSAILLNAKSDSLPYKLATVGIAYEGKAEVGDFKEVVFDQVEAEARTFAHVQLISRRIPEAAMLQSRLRLGDLFVLENTKKLFPVMAKLGSSMDFLLLLRLEELNGNKDASKGNFRLTLKLVDKTGQAFTEHVDLSRGKLIDESTRSTQQLTDGYSSPQELLARVDENGKSGSYDDFVSLFNAEGVRDLAGSLLMSAMMQWTLDELTRQQLTGGLTEVDAGTVAVRKVLQRWLPQSLSANQQEYIGKGLSTMMSSIGGASPDQAAFKEFVISMRKSVEGITDHRMFCIEMMQAFEKLTTKPYVYFGTADQNNEWQITQFGDRAIATLIDGSPGMATTITLQQSSGTWSITSLFNEMANEATPTIASPSSTEPDPSNLKTVTRSYSVGSFVTDSFFTGKGSFDLKDVYDKYEIEIEESLQDLAKTVSATCSQPPKFVQVLSGSRRLLIGHTDVGHQEIANFMRDIGINNDRIRMRGAAIEITQDAAKSLNIELTQHVLSAEEVTRLQEFANEHVAKRKDIEIQSDSSGMNIDFFAMDESLSSGTRTPIKQLGLFIPATIAARITPGTEQIQIRFDMHGLGNTKEQYVAPRFQTLTDGQSVLFAIADDFYWLATANIVHDRAAVVVDADNAPRNILTSLDEPVGPKYSGHPISWWLDSYWDNATASPKTAENSAQEYVASEAIRKLRDLPECKAAIEAALEKWFELVEHEVNEIQLIRAARCIVLAAGPEYQELAVAYLLMIWRQLPALTLEKQIERSGEETELNDLLKQLVLNDALAIQFAERLTNGISSDRSFVTYYLISSAGLKDEQDPKVAELNAWLHNHRELFIPAFSAALKDDSEHVRWFSLSSLIGLDLKHPNVLSTLTSVIESDASPEVRWLAVEMLSSKEMLSVAQAQNIELAPLLIKTLASDSSTDVRYSALGALMELDGDNELVHATLLEWARCKERLQVEYALSLMLRNHESGDRPQSIDELIELLSDPEWGTTLEVKQNNYRWARQYAIANLGQYAVHAHRALPMLEAELARNNKDMLSFTTEAIDSVRGYCPDLPIDKLQGEWEFISLNRPTSTSAFFDFPLHPGGVDPGIGREVRTASAEQPASIINVSGTQLKLGDLVLAEISHQRQGAGALLLIDPNGKKRHCNGWYKSAGDQTPESPLTLTLEVCELHDDPNATQATKQIYEFRPVRAVPQ